MKHIITLIALVYNIVAFAQTDSENYIKSKIYKKPSTEITTANEVSITVHYYDGLGKNVQSIAVGAGGSGQDIITPVTYDWVQRKSKQYLPFADPNQAASSLEYRNPLTLLMSLNSAYQQKFPGEISPAIPNPYSETFYEPSPLNRIIEESAPGQNWLASGDGGGHTIKYNYNGNSAREVRKFEVKFPIANGLENTEVTELICTGYYKIGELNKIITKNENWVPADGNNNTVEEFKDKLGRIVLKRTYNENQKHDTYYVYDNYGNLTYVLPPKASDAVVQTIFDIQPFKYNFPWTKLSVVDNWVSDRYDALIANYDNSEILNLDFLDLYGGKGGFSLIPDIDNNLTLNINITTSKAMPYRTGVIAELGNIGTFADKELGRISGPGYEYIFSVAGNMIISDGYGEVPSINTSLTGGHKLEYSKNYPWTKLCEVDSRIAEKYDQDIAGLDNSEILTTYTPNGNDAMGGIAVSLDEFDTLSLSMNINSSVPMQLVKGVAFTLDVERSISDRILGTISGNGYSYEFSVKNNSLYIDGYGYITNVMHFFSQYTNANHEVNQQAVSMGYIYHYDKRNRMMEKHIPDNGWTHVIYDRLDRPVLTQDENLRLKNDWLFTKYDEFSRVIMTGKYTDTAARKRAVLQHDLDVALYELNETKYSTPTTGLPGGFYLYYSTNLSFPPTGTLYTIQYYDDYLPSRDAPEYCKVPGNVFGKSVGSAKGLPTTSHVKVLDGGNLNWVTETLAYDKKGRQIWKNVNNSYLGTGDISESKLNFTGQPVEIKKTHTKNGTSLSIHDYYEYDTPGRLLRQSQSINGGAMHTLVFNHYDELGNLDQKKVGASAISNYNTAQALQTVDYTYNIRGWLRGINNIETLGNDLFAFGLNYSDLGDLSLYDGNIAQTSWKSITDDKLKRYDYEYDALNRLTDAGFYEDGVRKHFSEGGLTYDKNGNILTLARWGLYDDNVSTGTIDNLAYSYKPFSNQLLKVTDFMARPEGFNDLNTGESDDYAYDAAGNMIKDLNKNLGNQQATRITYNHLNLPENIIKDADHKIKYIYDADGQKLEKQVTNGTGISTITQYANGLIYENNALQYFSHPEGYVKRESDGDFTYVYQYKDHLGNIRLSYSDLDKDGVINDTPGMYEDFENGISNWNGYYSTGTLVLDDSEAHSGKHSGKITSPVTDERYSRSIAWMDIDNNVDTEYTYTVYFKSNSPQAELVLFMNNADETGYVTAVDSHQINGNMTEWTKLEKTVLVRKEIKKLGIRLDTNYLGTIWFDDITIKKTNEGPSEIVDHTDYYPFGMEHGNNIVMSGGNSTAEKIKFLGQERQYELGLTWDSFRYRNYDYTIGRFFGVDPISEKFVTLTPYQFAHNNPIWKIELEGLEGTPSNGARDLLNESPFISNEIMMTTLKINSTKEHHFRADTPLLTMQIGVDLSKEKSIENNLGNANGKATAASLYFSYSVVKGGDQVGFTFEAAKLSGEAEALGDEASGEFTTFCATGVYNLETGERSTEVEYLSANGEIKSGSTDNVFAEDVKVSFENAIASIELNLTQAKNATFDFANLLTSYFESFTKNWFDNDNKEQTEIDPIK